MNARNDAAKDTWINAEDLWKFLLLNHIDPKIVADGFGMYPPDMICLRSILSGDVDGCAYMHVRILKTRKVLGVTIGKVKK